MENQRDPKGAPLWAGCTVPDGYELSDEGIYRWNGRGEQERIADPAWVTARTRDHTKRGWGIIVHWIDQDGDEHVRAFPAHRLHDPRSSLAADLAAEGLAIVPGREKLLVQFLGSFQPANRLESVARLGWLDGQLKTPIYVLPERILTPTEGHEVIFQPERHSPTVNTMRAKGTLKQWQRAVADACRGNPFLLLALCCPFAGPLLKFAGMDSCGFHLYGESSQGKTTALQIAASVWGCGADPATSSETYIRSWNTTGNALEGLAAAHNDGLLALDEMGTCDAADFGKVVYDLAGGQGKSRMTKESELREQRFWRILFLSTGEISVRQRIEDGTRRAKAGQLNRFLDIPVETRLIADAHGKPPEQFVNELKRACATFYGTAGPEFVRKLIDYLDDIQSLQGCVREGVENWSRALAATGEKKRELQSAERRSLRRLALVSFAGYLACEFGVLPFTSTVIDAAIQFVLEAWLGDEGNLPEPVRAIMQLRDYVISQQSRFVSIDDLQNPRSPIYMYAQQSPARLPHDLAGYRDEDSFLLTDQGLREACRGYSVRTVIRELAQRRLLIQNNPGHFKSRRSIPGLSERLEFYVIDRQLLGAELGRTATHHEKRSSEEVARLA